MEKSQSIQKLTAALLLFKVKMGKVKKDATNPFFKSRYASLSNILDAIAEPLNESGITFCQFPTGEHGLTTIIMFEDEWIQSEYKMRPAKDDPQGVGSAITYQRRYALAAILGLNIDDDDDANAATFGGKTPEQAEENNKAWLNKNSKEFEGAVEKLKAGKSSISALRNYFKISKEVETLLMEAAKLHTDGQPAPARNKNGEPIS